MKDEGVIKFNCSWQQGALPPGIDCTVLLQARNELFRLGLIGYDAAEQVGYGNISMRLKDNAFIISGTQTGHISSLTTAGLSLVTDADIAGNTVHCCGPAKASSESLTHAAVYRLAPAAQAVIHVHHNPMWLRLKGHVPTTLPGIGYGTRSMADEIARLLKEAKLGQEQILVMAGHQDGIISFGSSMDEALHVLLQHYNRVPDPGAEQ